jgi:hypothetical protein
MGSCKIGWRNWENQVKTQLQKQCRVVLDLPRGADFLCIMREGTVKLVEAKCGNSKLTNAQKAARATAEERGIKYEVVRGE